MSKPHSNEYHRKWRAENKDKHRASVDKYRASPKGRRATRARYLKATYNMTLEAYEMILDSQNGVCGICLQEMKPPCIDHNHETGAIRGLLCRNCNAGIGQMKDDAATIFRAVTYLNRTDRSQLISPLAIIGGAPEHREFYGTDAVAYYPEIHPTVRINSFATVDAGYERPTTIGAHTLCMTKTHVGHDAIIGSNVELAPLTSVGGYAEIGDNVKVGQGCCFKPYVKVGEGARIGMGAVVIHDVPPGEVWVGNPARKMVKKTSRPPEALTTDDEMWTRLYQR